VPSAFIAVARIVDQRDQRRDVVGRPVARHQRLMRCRRGRRRADQADHLVDIGDGGGEAESTWARSRALLSRKRVRRVTTSSRNSTKAERSP
jgi:hypothetical protein